MQGHPDIKKTPGIEAPTGALGQGLSYANGIASEIMNVEPLERKWEAFGWDTVRVNGHDMAALCGALDRFDGKGAKPLAIIADTVNGAGPSSPAGSSTP